MMVSPQELANIILFAAVRVQLLQYMSCFIFYMYTKAIVLNLVLVYNMCLCICVDFVILFIFCGFCFRLCSFLSLNSAISHFVWVYTIVTVASIIIIDCIM